MMTTWAEDEEIVCVHPGGTRLVGYDAVRIGWEQLFAGDARLTFRLDQVVMIETVGLAMQSAVEHVALGSDGTPRGAAICTNVFLRTPSGWRMVMHPLPGPIATGDAPAGRCTEAAQAITTWPVDRRFTAPLELRSRARLPAARRQRRSARVIAMGVSSSGKRTPLRSFRGGSLQRQASSRRCGPPGRGLAKPLGRFGQILRHAAARLAKAPGVVLPDTLFPLHGGFQVPHGRFSLVPEHAAAILMSPARLFCADAKTRWSADFRNHSAAIRVVPRLRDRPIRTTEIVFRGRITLAATEYVELRGLGMVRRHAAATSNVAGLFCPGAKP